MELPGTGVFTASLAPADSPGTVLGHAFLGEDGTFRFDQVSSGSYDLFVSGTSHEYRFFGRRGSRRVVRPARSARDAESGPHFRVIVRGHRVGSLTRRVSAERDVSDAYLDPWNFGMGAITTAVKFGSEQVLPNVSPGRHRLSVTGSAKAATR